MSEETPQTSQPDTNSEPPVPHPAVADAQRLAESNADVRRCAGVMLAGRHLYAMAVQEMERLLSQLKVTSPAPTPKPGEPLSPTLPPHEPHPETIGEFIAAAQREANAPFDQAELLTGMIDLVMPWMQQTVKRNVQADREAKAQELADRENARRRTALPLGTPFGMLPRDKALILVGDGMAVKYLLTLATGNLLAAQDPHHPYGNFSVIRFCLENRIPASTDQRLLHVNSQAWHEKASSKTRLDQFMMRSIAPQQNRPADALVVDDLAALYSSGIMAPGQIYAGGYAPWRFQEACTIVRRLLQQAGAALIAGIPCEPNREVLNLNDFRPMRETAMVKSVRVNKFNDQPDKVELIIDEFGSTNVSLTVDASLLNPSGFILAP